MKCRYSGRICRVEEMLNRIDQKSCEKLVKRFCLDNKENCNQYKEFEESGIGFYFDVINLLESASNLYKRIRKKD